MDRGHPGDTGEEALELLSVFGISSPSALAAKATRPSPMPEDRLSVVLKVVSPDALHKSKQAVSSSA